MKKLLLLPLLLIACAAPRDGETSYAGGEILSPEARKEAKQKPDFVKHVKPILETRCAVCHNRKTLPGLMSLENRKLAFQTNAAGMARIVPGHPEGSLLIANIRQSHAGVNSMPPVGERITKDELAILRTWIAQGAAWPEGRAGKLNPDAALH